MDMGVGKIKKKKNKKPKKQKPSSSYYYIIKANKYKETNFMMLSSSNSDKIFPFHEGAIYCKDLMEKWKPAGIFNRKIIVCALLICLVSNII